MELTYLDLAINNLVINIASGSEEICEVDAITKLGIAYDSETRKGTCGYANLKGIPLTDEWLFKFDFIECLYNESLVLKINENTDLIYSKDRCLFYIEITENNLTHSSLINLSFVHELQNLWFQLTKQELRIKPF